MLRTLFAVTAAGITLLFSVQAYSADDNSSKKEKPKKEESKKHEFKPIITPPTGIITAPLTPPTASCISADGKTVTNCR